MEAGLQRHVFRFSAHWLGNFLGVLLVALILDPHIRLPETGSGQYWATAAAFAAILAVLNAYARPLLYLAFLPATCCVMVVTLGGAHFLVGALMFWLAGQFVGPIFVESFGWALLGALITAAIATLVSWLILGRDQRARARRAGG
jgi:uncharacterized membrane protein YvlD (DUF360 family)